MHTIDLLKGQGLPSKTTLGSVFFVAIIFVIPLLVGAGIGGFYLINKTKIEITESGIEKLDIAIADLGPDAIKAAKLRKEVDFYFTKLTEVKKCVNTYVQWTPVLIDVVNDKPENMYMNSLTVTNEGRNAVRRNSDPNAPVVLLIPPRKVTLELSGRGTGDYNLIVRDYQNRLTKEPNLPPEFLHNPKFLRLPRTSESNEDTYTMDFVLQRQ